MGDGSRLVPSTVLFVLAATVVSGPLVGAVDLTPARTPPPAGTGSADVRVDSVPDRVVLERGAFGAGTYHPTAPTGRATVGAVEGNPVLEYVIRIRALDFVDINEYELRRFAGGELRLSLRPVEISPHRVTEDTYVGSVTVRLQSDEYAVLYDGAIRIVVVG